MLRRKLRVSLSGSILGPPRNSNPGESVHSPEGQKESTDAFHHTRVLVRNPRLNSRARAGVTIGGSGTVYVLENHVVSGELQIEVIGQGSPADTITITATGGSNPIRYIHVGSIGTSAAYMTTLFVNESGGTIPYIRQIDVISASPDPDGEVTVGDIQISGDVGDPSSPHTSYVFADVVANLHPTGDITADVISGPRLYGAASSISELKTTGGDIVGDISATGSITTVQASGNIGSSSNYIVIVADDSIGTVKASSAWAGVATGSSSNLHRIETTTDGFHGEIDAGHMDFVNGSGASGFSIAGDLDADVTFATYAAAPSISVGGSIPLGRTFQIGESFGNSSDHTARTMSIGTLAGTLSILPGPSSDHGNLWGNVTIGSGGLSGLLSISGSLTSTITIPASGLSGQIIINAGDSGDAWSGSVVVGSTTLSSSTYTNTPASLGGGAVGLAPFDLHDNGCDPVNGGHADGWTHSVTLTFYGPIDCDLSPIPVKVFTRVGTGSWTDITYNFTAASVSGRELVISPISAIVGTPTTNYKIVPVGDAITCLDVTGNPAVVNFEYDLLN